VANKTLQFTYFWADEDVMQADFAKKYSQAMTDWAVDFYARYGFDVEVNPPPDNKPHVLPLSKFALQKRDGIRPDMRSSDEQNKALEERRKRVEEDQARSEKAKKQAEAANNGPEVKRLEAELDDLRRKWFAVMDEIIASYNRDEYGLRELLMLKYLNDRIVHGERFTVVFCRFRYTGLMQMRMPERGTTGQTYDKLTQPIVRFYGSSVVLPLWSGSFAIIDPFRGDRRNVAHEAVHAAGHAHPFGQYLQSVEKRYRGRRLPGRAFEPSRDRSLAPDYDDPAFDFDETPHYAWFRGGYDDGPSNDLMNYTLQDPEPTEVNLRPAHVDLMNGAYFAK